VNFISSIDKRGHSAGSPTVVAGDLREIYLFLGRGTERGKCKAASIGETLTTGKLEKARNNQH
jgi:hypothetical protein